MRIVPRESAIYRYISDQGISRDELARRMGVSSATTYRVETGKVDPSPLFIASLITVTGLPFDELFEIVRTAEAVA